MSGRDDSGGCAPGLPLPVPPSPPPGVLPPGAPRRAPSGTTHTPGQGPSSRLTAASGRTGPATTPARSSSGRVASASARLRPASSTRLAAEHEPVVDGRRRGSRTDRISRWVVPVTALTLAVSAIVLLGLPELEEQAPRLVASAAGSVATAAPPRSPPARPVARPSGPARPPAVDGGAAASAGAPTPAGPAGLAGRIAALPEVCSRLELLERTVESELAAGRPDEALAALERLLDAPIPGDFDDVQALRLSALAQVGRLPGERSDAVLARRASDGERPRPERLLAVELLAGRPASAGRADLARVARGDHDPVVEARARWALQQETR